MAKRAWSTFFITLSLGGLLLLAFAGGQTAKTKPTPPPASKDQLSKEEYEQVKNHFVDLIQKQDPKAALSELSVQMKSDPRIYRSCHPLAHIIGQESYKKYNNFSSAMRYQDEVCASGYLHGVMEAYFDSQKESVSTVLKTVCSDPSVPAYLSGNCYHAIGHGLMYYSANNLPKSLSLCLQLGVGNPQKRCTEGVYMENFNTDRKLHPSKFLKTEDLFYPCDDSKLSRHEICYFYAPVFYLSLHPEDYTGALSWCETSGSFKYTCADGLGSRIMKENIDRPGFVEKICDSNSVLRNSCIAGIVSYYSVNFNSLAKTRDMCQTLSQQDQQACIVAVNAHRGMFLN